MKTDTMIAKLIFIAVMLTLMFGCAPRAAVKDTSSDDATSVITNISVIENSMSVTSNTPFVYTLYSGSDPYKVTLEIPDIKTGNYRDKIISDKPGITEVNIQQIETPKIMTKLEIVLQTPSSVVPLYKDNVLTLIVKQEEPVTLTEKKPEEHSEGKTAEVPSASGVLDKAPDTVSAPKTEEKSFTEKTSEATLNSASLQKATVISKIDLVKSPDTMNVVILGNGSMSPNVFPIDERIVVDIQDVSMHGVVVPVATAPLKGIRVGRHKNKVRIVLDLKEKTNYEVTAVGNSIEISLKKKETLPVVATISTPRELPPTPREPAVKAIAPKVNGTGNDVIKEITSIPDTGAFSEGKYKGKKISLDFQDAEIGSILRLLADVNGYNLVIDPVVKGKITIKLMNVPWDQALDIILNSFNFRSSLDGNILWIAPSSMFDKIVDDKSKARENAEKSEELMQDVIRINYAMASDLQGAITQGKLLTPRGSITVDNRMNTLIIKDIQKSVDKMKELVKIMDVPKPQVMIEAKIVQVSSNYSENLGIRWGGNFASQTFPNTMTGTFSVNTPTVTSGPSATAPGGGVGITVGHANLMNVSLSLSALESVKKAKTLSNPKVLTMDNEAATIQQGSTFFISTVSQAGTQTQQQSATLSLTVTPKIAPDGTIQLKVNATDNALVSVNPPVVDTKSLTTQALVKNGETLVLGGIYTSSKTEDSDEVPILSKIPILGWLFKTKTQTGPDVKELLIFITPTLVNPQADNK